MNVLIVGSGGREHAMAWKIRQSQLLDNLYIAPGNAGTAALATNIQVEADDFANIARLCRDKNIDLLVVGPEVPLVLGLRDYLEDQEDLQDLLIVGPGSAGALLEGSKAFSKSFMQKFQIPTARSRTFDASTIQEAYIFLKTLQPPYVLKADGLAAGKGVLIIDNLPEAKLALNQMILDRKFGEASRTVVIEEFLQGVEVSVFVLTDGQDYVLLPEAKDYKRIGEADQGPNTGGMGAVSPVPFADKAFMQKVREKIIHPTLAGLRDEKIPFRGFIFFGLINVKDEPYVIEYNVRMGDPETQAVLPRIGNDLLELLITTAKGELSNVQLQVLDQAAVTVVMVAGGYPEKYRKGDKITGLNLTEDSLVFHAGTGFDPAAAVVTNGGRVMAVTGTGSTALEALKNSYQVVEKIHWDDVYYRRDIGKDIL